MARIDDVARKAGVSSSTVSYVLSGKRSISKPTRDRVLQAVKDLGYRPHAGARALASSRTNVIGLMLPLRPGVNVAVVMEFAGGVVTRARELAHDVLIVTADDPDAIGRAIGGSMVDSLIVMDVESNDPRIAALANSPVPVMLIGLPDDPGGLSCVDFDFEGAGRLAVARLAARGHTHLALIGSPPSVYERGTSYARRLDRGYRAACADRGLEARVLQTTASIAAGQEAVTELLAAQPEITGVVVHNEAALPGVLMARAGLREPLDVVAIAPESIATGLGTRLDLIALPAQAIGREAVDLVMAQSDDGAAAQTRLLSPQARALDPSGS
ncbi:MAG TPA: LacI family DNA-binding transcriptional regulator [Propionibacteriaceae bacterium]|nr:LacI family DNA-binding transcriptional regulator [Propionibacteriaceae bacterium]